MMPEAITVDDLYDALARLDESGVTEAKVPLGTLGSLAGRNKCAQRLVDFEEFCDSTGIDQDQLNEALEAIDAGKRG